MGWHQTLFCLGTSCCLVAQSPSVPTVQEILARNKAASGGDLWNAVGGLTFKGRLTTGGMKGTLETTEDLRSGRTRSGFDLGAIQGVSGFDGRVTWNQDKSGDVQVDEKPVDLGLPYWLTRAHWFPERASKTATITYAGLREGRFHALRICPGGPSTYELWIDGQSWLAERLITEEAGRRQVATFEDYRSVGGLMLPFRSKEPGEDPRLVSITEWDGIQVNNALDAKVFERPMTRLSDYGIDGGQASTTAPLQFRGNHLFVQARINGAGPFLFFLDTGGVNVLTPSVAKRLALAEGGQIEGGGVGDRKETFGITRVDRVQVGGAWMREQSFYVIPSLEDIGHQMGMDVAGILGYELLRRFIAKADLDTNTLILSDPKGWTYKGTGTGIAFTFNRHHPRIQGTLDGIPGVFEIDTGSGATLDVFSPFVEAHPEVKAAAPAAISTITGSGVGGELKGEVIRAKRLELGGVEVLRPVVGLSMAKAGSFADSTAIGNVGQGFLKRFNITFDYGHQKLYLEPNQGHSKPDRWNLLGFRLTPKDPALVAQVYAGSGAERAGLKPGDRLLGLDGKPMDQWAMVDLLDQLQHGQPGKTVEIRLRSGEQERTIRVVLEDQL